jgi:tRNA (adenine22-N1)-methyltransferase
MLSPRLTTIFDAVPPCRCAADIGTDHGYLAAQLIRSGRCPACIATDIHAQPLERARGYFADRGISGAQTRLGPGLTVLSPGECDVIVVAGMGGYAIRDMLAADPAVAREASLLILQPMNNTALVRRFLADNHFAIEDEWIAEEEGKFYEIMGAVPGNMTLCEPLDAVIGYGSARHPSPAFKGFVAHKIASTRRMLSQVEEGRTLRARRQQHEGEELLRKLQEVEHELESK